MTTATQLQLRRGTSTQCDAMTPAEGEPVVDLTHDRFRIGDGLIAGGIVIPNAADIQKQAFTFCASSGTGDAIVLTTTATAVAAGVFFEFVAPGSNSGTGTVTLTAGSIAVHNVMKIKNGALVDLELGDLISGLNYRVNWNVANSVYQLINVASGNDSGMTLLGVFSASGGGIDVNSGFSNADFSSYRIAYEINGTSGNYFIRHANGGSLYATGYACNYNGVDSTGNSNIPITSGSQLFIMGTLDIFDSFVSVAGVVQFISNAVPDQAPFRCQSYGLRDRRIVGGTTNPLDRVFFGGAGGGITSGRAVLYGLKY